MHNIEPSQKYKILTLRIAVPEEVDDNLITDGLNEILNDMALDFGDESTVPVVDWAYGPTIDHIEAPEVVEEGCLFFGAIGVNTTPLE